MSETRAVYNVGDLCQWPHLDFKEDPCVERSVEGSVYCHLHSWGAWVYAKASAAADTSLEEFDSHCLTGDGVR